MAPFASGRLLKSSSVESMASLVRSVRLLASVVVRPFVENGGSTIDLVRTAMSAIGCGIYKGRRIFGYLHSRTR